MEKKLNIIFEDVYNFEYGYKKYEYNFWLYIWKNIDIILTIDRKIWI